MATEKPPAAKEESRLHWLWMCAGRVLHKTPGVVQSRAFKVATWCLIIINSVTLAMQSPKADPASVEQRVSILTAALAIDVLTKSVC